MPIRNGATGDGDEMGRLLIGQGLPSPGLLLISQYGLNPAFAVPPLDIPKGLVRDREGFSDLGIAPAFVAFEQDPCTGQRSGIGLSSSDKDLDIFSFVSAELDGGYASHVCAPFFTQHITNFKLD